MGLLRGEVAPRRYSLAVVRAEATVGQRARKLCAPCKEALRRFEIDELERAFVARTIAESLSKIDGGRVAATWFVDVGLAGKTSHGA